jgi:hypothetical protein
MVACWPNYPDAIARAVDISMHELRYYLSGKASLKPEKMKHLFSLLHIHVKENSERVAAGPCVMIAASPLSVRRIYRQMFSRKDDGYYGYCFEAVHNASSADWRYIVFAAQMESPSVFMIPPDSAIYGMEEKILFPGFQGKFEIPGSVFTELTHVCMISGRQAKDNIEMIRFGDRHKDLLRRIDEMQRYRGESFRDIR